MLPWSQSITATVQYKPANHILLNINKEAKAAERAQAKKAKEESKAIAKK